MSETYLIKPPGGWNKRTVMTRDSENRDWSDRMYEIEAYHNKGYRGEGVTVAVLDTGVQPTHKTFRDFKGDLTVLSTSGSNGIDQHFHGTFCISQYISKGQLLGWSPDIDRMISIAVLSPNGSGILDWFYQGCHVAIDQGANIISASLGSRANGTTPRELVDINARMASKGIIAVAAAGNDGKSGLLEIDNPAAADYWRAVGSHDDRSQPSRFSDKGIQLDYYNAGEKVLGAGLNDSILSASGTSFSTPKDGALAALFYRPIIEKHGKITQEIWDTYATDMNLRKLTA